MRNLTFSKVFITWFLFDLIMMFINGATIKSSLFVSICNASIGFFLLICPVYPQNFLFHWDDAKSKKMIRIIAVIQIILSFMTKVNL